MPLLLLLLLLQLLFLLLLLLLREEFVEYFFSVVPNSGEFRVKFNEFAGGLKNFR